MASFLFFLVTMGGTFNRPMYDALSNFPNEGGETINWLIAKRSPPHWDSGGFGRVTKWLIITV